MGELILWPMSCAIYERKDETAHVVWADHSSRVISQSGLDDSWIGVDSSLARMRLEHTGWTELRVGKVGE